MRMKTSLVLSFTFALAGACFAQTAGSPPPSPEQTAVAANDRAYEAAYAKADAKALADFFADDADYTTEEGRAYSGRAAIAEAIKAGLLANRGSKLAIVLDSVKVLTPETVVEKGSTTVSSKTGEANKALFTAIHVKKDGKWKISQLIESPIPDVTAREHLEELA